MMTRCPYIESVSVSEQAAICSTDVNALAERIQDKKGEIEKFFLRLGSHCFCHLQLPRQPPLANEIERTTAAAAGTGCKHGSSGRLLGTRGYAEGLVQSAGQPDFSEEEVWLASSYSDPNEKWPESTPDRIYSNDGSPSNRCRVGGLSLALDGARNDRRSVGGLPSALEGRYNAGTTMIRQHRLVDRSGNRHVAAASAPINVPGWSKLVRVDSTDSASDTFGLARDESEWVPPHEYLEREYGKNVTTSVVEGMGRTLKGRDMSQVRDAVWSQTGFFG